MSSSLLKTKLYAPQPRPERVVRPRLIERLDDGLAGKLTLVSAAAGFGKTTLLSGWVRSVATPAAWVTLDDGDNDLVRFLTYVVNALRTLQEDFGESVLTLLQARTLPSPARLAMALVNDLSDTTGDMLLILDDYHAIDAQPVHDVVAYLVDGLPPQHHIVIATRSDPTLPLSRLRAGGELVELRAADLRFTPEEATDFLQQIMGVELSPDALDRLNAKIEGWAVGLQLAGLAMSGHDDTANFIETFSGSHRYVIDYLTDEVMQRQPDDVRRFLRETSILASLNSGLCDAVTARQNSQDVLSTLEQANLFLVPLDDRREWFRYHHLFSEALRFRLHERSDDEGVREFHRRAASWYERHDFTDEALHHWLEAGDYVEAAELIEEAGLDMIGRSQLGALQNWIDGLPESLVSERPYLSVLLAWVGGLTGQRTLAESQLAAAEKNLELVKDDRRSEISCQIALLHAYAARNRSDLAATIQHTQEALRRLPENNVFLDCTIHLNLGGNYRRMGDFAAAEEPLKRAASFRHVSEVEYPALAAAGFLANGYLHRGRLHAAATLIDAIGEQEGSRPHPAMSYVYLEQGELRYERDDLDAAAEFLSKAIHLGEIADSVVNVIRARLVLAWVKQAYGDEDEAAMLVEQATDFFNRSNPHYQTMNQIEYDYYRVRSLLGQPNLPAALDWAHDYADRREMGSPWALLNELVYARVLFADGQAEQALDVVTACEKAARLSEMTGWVIRSLSLQALCHQSIGDAAAGPSTLSHALSLAEPEGYIRTFVDFGPPMRELLVQYINDNPHVDYVNSLLGAFPDQGAVQIAAPTGEALSEREVSILRLMAAGLSNREIADELYLSVNTIKWYTSQLYGKLGVGKRAEAVARAHELGIL